jgi:hypothetical protein
MDNDKFDRWAEERRQRRAERESRRHERSGQERGERESRRGGRKERVLHTRISDQLDESLRAAADEMRVPVSNLVRNVLEDVFTVVETVTENVGEMVSDIMEEADEVRDRLGKRRRRERDVTPRREERPDDPARQAAEREVEELLQEEPERAEFPNVVGWQQLVLNAEQQCADCGRDLGRGDAAFLAVTQGGDAPWLCPECLGARS